MAERNVNVHLFLLLGFNAMSVFFHLVVCCQGAALRGLLSLEKHDHFVVVLWVFPPPFINKSLFWWPVGSFLPLSLYYCKFVYYLIALRCFLRIFFCETVYWGLCQSFSSTFWTGQRFGLPSTLSIILVIATFVIGERKAKPTLSWKVLRFLLILILLRGFVDDSFLG